MGAHWLMTMMKQDQMFSWIVILTAMKMIIKMKISLLKKTDSFLMMLIECCHCYVFAFSNVVAVSNQTWGRCGHLAWA